MLLVLGTKVIHFFFLPFFVYTPPPPPPPYPVHAVHVALLVQYKWSHHHLQNCSTTDTLILICKWDGQIQGSSSIYIKYWRLCHVAHFGLGEGMNPKHTLSTTLPIPVLQCTCHAFVSVKSFCL